MIREQVFIFFMKACSFYSMLCVILKLFTEKTDYSFPEGYIIMIIEERLQKQLRRASILVFGIIAVFFICGGLFSAYLRRIKSETMQEQVAAEAEEYKIRILKQLEADLQTLSSMAAVLKDVEDMQKMSEYLDEANQSNAFLAMAYFKQDGEGVISTAGRRPMTDAVLSDLTQEGQDGIRKALEGESSVSRLFMSNVSDNRVFAYSVPVYKEGQITGALTASDHIEIFEDILTGNTVMSGGGYIHMLGSEGNFLVRSSKSVVKKDLESIFDGPYLSGESRQETREALKEQKSVTSSFRYEGKKYPFLLEPVGINGWYLFCVNTGDGISENIAASSLAIQVTFYAVLLMVLLLMLYGYHLLRRYNRNLVQLAYHDPLTGAENLSCFRRKLDREMQKGSGSVAAVSIQRFPFIKETFGNERAERLLYRTKTVIERHLKKEEFFCRDTEDRFYIFLTDTDKKILTSRMDRMLREIEHSSSIARTTDYQLKLYCGITFIDSLEENQRESGNLISRASLALERIIHTHVQTIRFFDTKMHQREKLEDYIEGHMEQALKDGEFRLFLQPKKNIQRGTLAGAEALVRWKKEDGRMIFPDQFIPLFENNGFCTVLDLYMVEQACRQIRSWMERGITPVPISVNQSKLLFYEPEYVQKLVDLTDRYQISPKMIILEILEGMALENVEELNKKVALLQEKGFRVSLDDFGSGYSSLNTLARLHINELKLDRGFLMNMSLEDQERGTLIIKKVIQMAKDLDISVVAEGVETPEDQELLRALQCDIGQGYLYSKPVEAEEFDEKFMIVKVSEKEEN